MLWTGLAGVGYADWHQRATVKRRATTLTVILLACLAVSLICVAYPMYVIRPFRHQGAGELAAALAVTRFRPAITILSGLTAVLMAIGYWRAQSRKWRRGLMAAGAALTVGLAFTARVNVFELMFHPDQHPSFTAAREVKLDAAEKVIAAQVGGEARAYPIRSMSYHHVVNDVLGGVAIVATY